jgi:hypothetical protein
MSTAALFEVNKVLMASIIAAVNLEMICLQRGVQAGKKLVEQYGQVLAFVSLFLPGTLLMMQQFRPPVLVSAVTLLVLSYRFGLDYRSSLILGMWSGGQKIWNGCDYDDAGKKIVMKYGMSVRARGAVQLVRSVAMTVHVILMAFAQVMMYHRSDSEVVNAMLSEAYILWSIVLTVSGVSAVLVGQQFAQIVHMSALVCLYNVLIFTNDLERVDPDMFGIMAPGAIALSVADVIIIAASAKFGYHSTKAGKFGWDQKRGSSGVRFGRRPSFDNVPGVVIRTSVDVNVET